MTLGVVPVGQKPESGPGSDGVWADESGFKIAGQRSLDATAVVL